MKRGISAREFGRVFRTVFLLAHLENAKRLLEANQSLDLVVCADRVSGGHGFKRHRVHGGYKPGCPHGYPETFFHRIILAGRAASGVRGQVHVHREGLPLSSPDKIMCSRGRILNVAVRFPQGRTEHHTSLRSKAPPCDLIHTLLHYLHHLFTPFFLRGGPFHETCSDCFMSHLVFGIFHGQCCRHLQSNTL